MKKFSILFLLMLFLVTNVSRADNPFIYNSGGQFMRNGEPYYYIGTNFWYGPILASKGEGGNINRLERELDSLQLLGINNLRVLVGADAGSINVQSVKPYLQTKPGVLNDTLLVGLDNFLLQLSKRNMVAVLYLNNSWDWSGGYGFYLKNAGKGDSPKADAQGYNDYVRYAAQFVKDKKAKELFYNYVKQIVSRTNSLTGKPYKDDPTIMAWQIANEPRSFSKEGKTDFLEFMEHTAQLIKQIDPNHMVSAGSEGSVGCENDMELYERIHVSSTFDYLTIHIWPMNWQWCIKTQLWEDLPHVYQKTNEYIESHLRLAAKIEKPLVIEEFGYPRDGNVYEPGSYTLCRDAFYAYVLDRVVKSSRKEDYLAGCNFWGWGGAGRPAHKDWQPNDDFVCDPPHEPQGWYSVFNNDSTTIEVIKDQISKLR